MGKKIFSGVQPTGNLHLGNYLGAIKNFVDFNNDKDNKCIFCVVDLHAITVRQDPKELKNNIRETVATFIASGIDPKKSIIFNQSRVAAHAEAAWILSCVARMGWLNRMTQFKEKAGKDKEKASIGLYSYPVLMAADILMFDATHVPVGADQNQHIEMTRDIAARFNHTYKKIFELPEAIIETEKDIVLGIDGRKMSKSYGNIIPLLSTEKALKKSIAKIVTNSLEPGEPKDTDGCSVFSLYSHFASKNELLELADDYKNGISWGDAKNKLFSLVNNEISPIRERYEEFSTNDKLLNELLHEGSLKARVMAKEKIAVVRELIGIKPIS